MLTTQHGRMLVQVRLFLFLVIFELIRTAFGLRLQGLKGLVVVVVRNERLGDEPLFSENRVVRRS